MTTPDGQMTMKAQHVVDVAISTCDRVPQYIHDTLLSMFEADSLCSASPVRLVVCGPDAGYLGDVSRSTTVRVDVLSAADWADMKARDAKRRVAHNFMRVLAGADARRPLIALQDDICFADGWLVKTHDIVSEITAAHGDDFILALYASYRFKGKPYYPYNAHLFYGNQALYLTPKARTGLLAFFRAATKLVPDDMMVKDYVLHSKTKLFVANPSLVQHVGECSAIEERFHRSPSF